jgi:hypothetical protein
VGCVDVAGLPVARRLAGVLVVDGAGAQLLLGGLLADRAVGCAPGRRRLDDFREGVVGAGLVGCCGGGRVEVEEVGLVVCEVLDWI